MAEKSPSKRRLGGLANRDLEIENARREPLERLNTYIPAELNRRLAHRSADKKGSKLQQVNQAVSMYLAIYDGYGSLSPDEIRAIQEKIAQQNS